MSLNYDAIWVVSNVFVMVNRGFKEENDLDTVSMFMHVRANNKSRLVFFVFFFFFVFVMNE
jgi:hypothetical protein